MQSQWDGSLMVAEEVILWFLMRSQLLILYMMSHFSFAAFIFFSLPFNIFIMIIWMCISTFILHRIH